MPTGARSAQPAPPLYDRRVIADTIDSHALGIPKSFYIFVPPDLAPGQRAPVMYLLRGHEREWVNPQEDGTRGGINVIDVYEQLRMAGQVGPLIMVFPGLSSADNSIHGLLVNMRAPELAHGAPGIGSGRFADYFFAELIPYIDAHYPSSAGRRGIAGFSLGGMMAIRAAAQRPDLFASAGAYDGTFLYARDRGQRVRLDDHVIHNPIFDPAYGIPRDLGFIADTSPANLILRGDHAALADVTWMIAYGARRLEPWHANYYRGEHLVRCLRARGLANTLPRDALPGGDHTWRTADAFMALTLPLHDRALRPAG